MNKRKLVSCGIVLLVALALLISTGHYWTRGVYISITNSTQSTLKRVDITCHGGVIHIAALEPTMSYGRYINPTHGTDLTLEWIDSMGVKHSHTVGVYMERNYVGSVEITVEPDNRVSVTDKIRSQP